MAVEHIGILHPGQMGVSVAASAGRGGHQVYWASEGRSLETRRRAVQASLPDLGGLARVVKDAPSLPPLDTVLAALASTGKDPDNENQKGVML